MKRATVQRNAKERIRGPRLAILESSSFPPGLPVEEGLADADRKNRVVASNKRLSKALVGSDEWKSYKQGFPCWAGTVTAYVQPGKTLRGGSYKISTLNCRAVTYVTRSQKRWIFPVPEEHLGKKNAILVSEHPDYTIEIDGRNRIIHATKADLIERFPSSNGWYLGDPEHDIPVGEKVDHLIQDARFLQRIAKRVGFICRYYDERDRGDFDPWEDHNLGPAIYLDVDPIRISILVEAP